MHEQSGERIIDSQFFRAFCAGCGEPIRASSADLGHDVWCVRCDPPPPRRRRYRPSDYDEPSPEFEYAVRLMEDGR